MQRCPGRSRCIWTYLGNLPVGFGGLGNYNENLGFRVLCLCNDALARVGVFGHV